MTKKYSFYITVCGVYATIDAYTLKQAVYLFNKFHKRHVKMNQVRLLEQKEI
jgi:hypothetical protein